MSTSERPSLLSQTRTDLRVAVAIRSPSGEYFAATTGTQSSWWRVSTRWRVAMSQTVAVRLNDATRSRVGVAESGEKSTPEMSSVSSQYEKTSSDVFASQTNTSPESVPAAIHLPSFDTARHWTPAAAIVAICLPSSILHTPSPSPPPTRYSPFAVNVTAFILLPPSISKRGEPSCLIVSINATPFPQYAPVIIDDAFISDTVAEQW